MKFYQVDAFADQVFKGNPAAIVPLDKWLTDDLMQNIAEENNLSETAFFVKENGRYHIRWFTPEEEVDLCGHATLAAAFVINKYIEPDNTTILFNSKSGHLSVEVKDHLFILDFPTDTLEETSPQEGLLESLGLSSDNVEVYRGKDDYLVIVEHQHQVEALDPDLAILNKINSRGVIVTAPGKEVDFVSRCFFPRCGIPEDPVTGSAHTTMIPYWAQKLIKTKMTARQISRRTGDLQCEYLDDRVKIGGRAVLYAIGEIHKG